MNLDNMTIEQLADLYFELKANFTGEETIKKIKDKANTDELLSSELKKRDNQLLNLWYN